MELSLVGLGTLFLKEKFSICDQTAGYYSQGAILCYLKRIIQKQMMKNRYLIFNIKQIIRPVDRIEHQKYAREKVHCHTVHIFLQLFVFLSFQIFFQLFEYFCTMQLSFFMGEYFLRISIILEVFFILPIEYGLLCNL